MIETTAFVREVLLPCIKRNPRIDDRYSCFALRVADSPIHGLGVFAREDIPAGRKVIEYTGERIDPAEKIRRSIRPIQFLFRLNDDVYIDGGVNGAAFSAARHPGSVAISSRWISTSFNPPPVCAETSACTAFTRLDFPIPRAPQSSALLAGNPRANRSVFASN